MFGLRKLIDSAATGVRTKAGQFANDVQQTINDLSTQEIDFDPQEESSTYKDMLVELQFTQLNCLFKLSYSWVGRLIDHTMETTGVANGTDVN